MSSHADFTGLADELVFGLTADGHIVSIRDVPSGLKCQCVCPACGADLVAHKGRVIAHHFKHRAAAASCGLAVETNAHIAAKRILEREKRIMLPAVTAAIGGERLQTRPARLFAFDSVRLETKLGNVVPDVILTFRGRELVVEIFVTHRCDAQKIAKLEAQGVSAIEVDLSQHRTCDEAALTEALLTQAPRVWLSGALVSEARERLSQQIAAARADKSKAAMAAARALVVAASKIALSEPEVVIAERELVRRIGLGDFIRFQSPETLGFIVEPSLWQAAILTRYVIVAASHAYTVACPMPTSSVLKHIADCLAPEFQALIPADVRRAARDIDASLLFPEEAIETYLEHLVDERILASGEYCPSPSVSVIDQLRPRLQSITAADRRLAEAERRVRSIVARLRSDAAAVFDLYAWLDAPIPKYGAPLRAAATEDGETWRRLDRDLDAIEDMLGSGPPASELLGLPLEEDVKQAEALMWQKEQEADFRRREKEEQDASARVASLRNAAIAGLGEEAASQWLRSFSESGPSFADLARESLDSHKTAMSRLAGAVCEMRAQEEQAQLARAMRHELEKAAVEAYGPEKAVVFVKSVHPSLGSISPRDYCVDQPSLQRCLALLPRRRTRHR